ncbi:PAS domain-containing protein [Falsiroseomonas sp. HW251]|uniref:PAS domain-containing protein n=1 Tax=Falsiroseomonas sp. HW251 TaxID=3390998 RepID=UPI003D31F7E0
MASAPSNRPRAAPDSGSPRRFRAHLLGLVLAVALPLVTLSAALVLWTAEGRRDEALRSLERTAQMLQIAIDRELGLTITALQALATAPAAVAAITEGAGGAAASGFRAQARALIEARPDALTAVWLVPPDSVVPVVNTLVPAGQPAPPLTATRFPPRPIGTPPTGEQIRREIAEGPFYVSDLLRGPLADWTIVVALPLRQDGRVVGLLGAGLTSSSLGRVLRAEAAVPRTTASLIDRGGVLVARSHDEARFVGSPVTLEVRDALARPGMVSALISGTTLDGEPVYAALRRLQTAPLTVAFGAPRAVLDAPLRRALTAAGLGAAAALSVAVGAALLLGRRLGAEVAALGEDALRLAEGNPLPPRAPARVQEVAAARDALTRSAMSLHESEGRFTRAVAAARIGTWEWDAATDHLTGSPGREALYGLPPGAIASLSALYAAIHPGDRAAVQGAVMRALAGPPGIYESDYRVIWPQDGSLRWLHTQGRAEFGRDGRPVRMSGAVVDVTARRLAEEALRESERRLRLAQEAAGIGVWERDLITGRATWSEQEYRLHGLDPAGPPPLPEELRAMIEPADRDKPLLFERLRDAGIAGDEANATMTTEYRVRRRSDGALRWVHLVGRALPGPDGRPARVVGISLDVTATREAEERQALLMREVDHRAKNALAVALSVVQLAPRDLPPEGFAAAVTGRIAAMARAHSLLAAGRWSGADLQGLAEGELATHGDHVALDGPQLRLAPDAAQPVAMLLHELATNAAKHGALSAPGGRVTLSWCLDKDGAVRLEWQERGGPRLSGPPLRRGFGSRLLLSLAERQLGGEVVFDWSEPEGLTVLMALPARHVAACG